MVWDNVKYDNIRRTEWALDRNKNNEEFYSKNDKKKSPWKKRVDIGIPILIAVISFIVIVIIFMNL